MQAQEQELIESRLIKLTQANTITTPLSTIANSYRTSLLNDALLCKQPAIELPVQYTTVGTTVKNTDTAQMPFLQQLRCYPLSRTSSYDKRRCLKDSKHVI